MPSSETGKTNTPIPDDWPIPDCIRSSYTAPKGGYSAYICDGGGIERKEIWMHDGEEVPDEVINKIEHEEPLK